MPTRRMSVGSAGEAVAARFFTERGIPVLGRNVRCGRDEIDLIVHIDGGPVAVEVKSGVGEGTRPWERFDDDKERSVRRAASSLGISRVDLVTVEFTGERVVVRWLPRIG